MLTPEATERVEAVARRMGATDADVARLLNGLLWHEAADALAGLAHALAERGHASARRWRDPVVVESELFE